MSSSLEYDIRVNIVGADSIDELLKMSRDLRAETQLSAQQTKKAGEETARTTVANSDAVKALTFLNKELQDLRLGLEEGSEEWVRSTYAITSNTAAIRQITTVSDKYNEVAVDNAQKEQLRKDAMQQSSIATKDLSTKIQELKARIDSGAVSSSQAAKQTRLLSRYTREVTGENDKLSKSIGATRQEKAQLRAQSTKLIRDTQSLAVSMNKAFGEANSLRASTSSLTAQVKALTGQMRLGSVTTDQVQSSVSGASQEYDSLVNQVNRLTASNQLSEKESKELTSSLASLSGALATAKTSAAKYDQQAVLNAKRDNERKKAILEQSGLTENLASRVRELTQLIRVEGITSAEASRSMEALKRESEDLAQKSQSLSKAAGITSAEQAKLTQQTTDLSEEFIRLGATSERVFGTVSSLEDNAAKLANEYRVLTSEIRLNSITEEEQKRRLEELDRLRSNLTLQVRSYTRENKAARNELDRLNASMSRVNTAALSAARSQAGMAEAFTGTTKVTNSANQIFLSFGDIVQDSAQFNYSFAAGMRAIGNNISFVSEQFLILSQKIKQQTGQAATLRTMFGALGKSLTGVGGLMVAINLAVTAFTIFSERARRAKQETEELGDQVDLVSGLFNNMTSSMSALNKELGLQAKSARQLEYEQISYQIEALTAAFPELTENVDRQTEAFDRAKKSLRGQRFDSMLNIFSQLQGLLLPGFPFGADFESFFLPGKIEEASDSIKEYRRETERAKGAVDGSKISLDELSGDLDGVSGLYENLTKRLKELNREERILQVLREQGFDLEQSAIMKVPNLQYQMMVKERQIDLAKLEDRRKLYDELLVLQIDYAEATAESEVELRSEIFKINSDHQKKIVQLEDEIEQRRKDRVSAEINREIELDSFRRDLQRQKLVGEEDLVSHIEELGQKQLEFLERQYTEGLVKKEVYDHQRILLEEQTLAAIDEIRKEFRDRNIEAEQELRRLRIEMSDGEVGLSKKEMQELYDFELDLLKAKNRAKILTDTEFAVEKLKLEMWLQGQLDSIDGTEDKDKKGVSPLLLEILKAERAASEAILEDKAVLYERVYDLKNKYIQAEVEDEVQKNIDLLKNEYEFNDRRSEIIDELNQRRVDKAQSAADRNAELLDYEFLQEYNLLKSRQKAEEMMFEFSLVSHYDYLEQKAQTEHEFRLMNAERDKEVAQEIADKKLELDEGLLAARQSINDELVSATKATLSALLGESESSAYLMLFFDKALAIGRVIVDAQKTVADLRTDAANYTAKAAAATAAGNAVEAVRMTKAATASLAGVKVVQKEAGKSVAKIAAIGLLQAAGLALGGGTSGGSGAGKAASSAGNDGGSFGAEFTEIDGGGTFVTSDGRRRRLGFRGGAGTRRIRSTPQFMPLSSGAAKRPNVEVTIMADRKQLYYLVKTGEEEYRQRQV